MHTCPKPIPPGPIRPYHPTIKTAEGGGIRNANSAKMRSKAARVSLILCMRCCLHSPFDFSLLSVPWSEHKGKHFLFLRGDKNRSDPSPHRKLDRGKGNEAAQDLAFAICNQYHQRTFVVRKKSILSRSFFGWYITTARKSDLQRFMLSTGGEVVRVTHNTLHPSRLISPHSHFRFFDECRQPVISHLSFFLLQPFHS